MDENFFKENRCFIGVDGNLITTNRNNIINYYCVEDLMEVKPNDLLLNDIDEYYYKEGHDVMTYCKMYYSIDNDCYVIEYGADYNGILLVDFDIDEEFNDENDREEYVNDNFCFHKSISYEDWNEAITHFISVLYSYKVLYGE